MSVYEMLGVDRNAPFEELRQACATIALSAFLDEANRGYLSEEWSARVQLAEMVVRNFSDPARRAAYDAILAREGI
ncbi:hypothetical protein CC79DRAFT_1372209 [Sarocladium strictum]